ncbi:transcriptional regulator [Oxalobacteraceae bacterium R-40]|uniref:Transcriptional regulator n=1 Tax=Keguizhuia sedimenti TaxID=3064264 RepID=A0ABU1BSM0_9BURK|nr:transcriptional regulator [Oxalobacteraceae bacterium R-40]
MKNTPFSKKLPDQKTVRTVLDIGEMAAMARKEQGLGQADVAGLNNCGVRFIVDLEKGKPTIRAQMLLDTLDLLGLEIIVKKKGLNK